MWSVKALRKLLGDLFDAAKESLGFKKVLQEVLLQSDKLGSHFTSVNDLQEHIKHNAELFKEVQEEIFKIGDETFQHLQEELQQREEIFDHQIQHLEEQIANEKDLGVLAAKKLELLELQEEKEKFQEINAERVLHLQEEATNNLQASLNNLVSQNKSLKKIEHSFANVKLLVDEIGSQLRDPKIFAEKTLANLGKLPILLAKARKEGKTLLGVFKDIGFFLAKKAKDVIGLIFSPTGLLLIGIGAAVAAMTTLYKLFVNYWDFLDKKIIPANAEFNKEVGATSQNAGALKGQMNAVGVEMEFLGYSFEEGAGFVRDFVKAANTMDIPRDILKTGKELTFILGLGAEQAGKLAQQFQKQGAGAAQVNEMFNAGAKEAKAYGLPVNEVLRDIGEAPDILARFGVANRKEFAVSTAKAKSYGLSIKEVNAAFGKQLDTFEGSATASAKLNATFGTHINSLKLMMQKDPVKRMEMLRGELLKQGKSWEKLSVFERNVITESLGVDEAQAQLVLSSDEVRKKLEQQAKVQKQKMKDDEKWNNGMRSIQKTLLNWGAHLDKIMRKVSDLVSRIFGFKNGADVVESFVDMTVKGLDKVNGAIDWVSEAISSLQQGLRDGGKDFGFFGQTGILAFKTLRLGVTALMKPFELLWFAVKKVFDFIVSGFQMIGEGWKNIGSWVGPLLEKLLGVETGSFDLSGFGQSIVSDLNKGLDEAQTALSDNEPVSETPKVTKIKTQKEKTKVADAERQKKAKEEKKKEQESKNKELANAIGDAVGKKLASSDNGPMEIIIKTVNGDLFAKGIVKNARGTA